MNFCLAVLDENPALYVCLLTVTLFSVTEPVAKLAHLDHQY